MTKYELELTFLSRKAGGTVSMNLEINDSNNYWLFSDTLNNISHSGDWTPAAAEAPTGILCKQNGVPILEVNDFKPLSGGRGLYKVGYNSDGTWKTNAVWADLQVYGGADPKNVPFTWKIESRDPP